MIVAMGFVCFALGAYCSMIWSSVEAKKHQFEIHCRCGRYGGHKVILADPVSVLRHRDALSKECPHCIAEACERKRTEPAPGKELVHAG